MHGSMYLFTRHAHDESVKKGEVVHDAQEIHAWYLTGRMEGEGRRFMRGNAVTSLRSQEANN